MLFFAFYISPVLVNAQCPMCKTALESNNKQKSTTEKKFGRGINNGILYLLAMPYIAVGAVGYVWWKRQKSDGSEKR